MFKTILVPVDLGHPEHAAEILAKARVLVGDGARLVTLYVTPEIPGYVLSELPEGTAEKAAERASHGLAAMAGPCHAEPVVRRGPTAATILDVASEIGADLIVIASHRPGLTDYFLGSTASRVVRHAPCSVLVDRRSAE